MIICLKQIVIIYHFIIYLNLRCTCSDAEGQWEWERERERERRGRGRDEGREWGREWERERLLGEREAEGGEGRREEGCEARGGR